MKGKLMHFIPPKEKTFKKIQFYTPPAPSFTPRDRLLVLWILDITFSPACFVNYLQCWHKQYSTFVYTFPTSQYLHFLMIYSTLFHSLLFFEDQGVYNLLVWSTLNCNQSSITIPIILYCYCVTLNFVIWIYIKRFWLTHV